MITIVTLTRENILKEIAILGRDLVRKSSTNYWSCEDHKRAADYVKKAETLRGIYRQVRDCPESQLGAVLSSGEKVMAGESNHLRLLRLGWEGKLKGPTGWMAVGGELKFVE